MEQAPQDLVGIANVEDVTVEGLLPRVRQIAEANMRPITTTCIDSGDNFEVLYHFGKGAEMLHLRLVVPKDAEVPSISDVYFGAVLAENEMGEMFGMKLTGLALDYRGRMLLSEDIPPAPMLKSNSVG